MTLKQFLKPDWRKIVIFVIISILANIPYVGYFTFLMPGCSPASEIPIPCANLANAFNPVLNPIFWLWGGEDDIPLAAYSYSGSGNIYYALIILNIVYWYLLSCLIVWIYDNFRKVKKR